jgi:multiple sugar transport system substrate-binding protein
MSRRSLVSVVAVLGIVLGACSSGASPTSSAPAASVASQAPAASAASQAPAASAASQAPAASVAALPSARIAVWSGPEADNLRKVAAEYTKATGNAIVIEEIARDGYSDKLKTAIVGGSADFDGVYLSADWVPAFVAAGGLEPLDQFINGADKASFLNLDNLQPGVSNLTVDGKIYGFPSEGDTAWLFYRTDLLSAAGIQPPTTMAEMLAAAQKLTTPDRYGLVIGNKIDEAWWDFMHYFWAFGGQLFDPTTYAVTVNNAAGVKALTFYSDLLRKYKVVSPDVTTYGYNEIMNALQQDKAAMGVEWMAATKDLQDCTKSPKICDKIAYEFVPPDIAGQYGFGGSSWGWSVPTASQNKLAGYKFIEWLVGGPGAKLWALNGGIPSNTAALTDPEVVAQVPQFKLLAEAMPYRHISPLLTTADQLINAMADASTSAVTGAKTPQQAMDDAAVKITAALKEGGYLK